MSEATEHLKKYQQPLDADGLKVGVSRQALDETIAEVEALRRDIACRDGGLGSLYKIREALGFNRMYPLSHLDDDAKNMRTALLACAPIAYAAIQLEKNDYIGNSDVESVQPVQQLTIHTTLGVVREARRALFVVGLYPPTHKTAVDRSEVKS